ncbi:hypothetical protein [uncultured Leifsonia sp.]|uniref:hypothetical protein n=1 Tax=uncultured Leifsonia sp. TaxID=340359 RepID=UPI0026011EBB|nr:hypothetical protein [uncultured Leifsonia sp.]
MARTVSVDAGRLRAGTKTLEGAATGRRPSADESDGFGSSVARGAVSRFERYWVRGQSTIDELVAGLAGALAQAADAYERRDAEDAEALGKDRAGFYGF